MSGCGPGLPAVEVEEEPSVAFVRLASLIVVLGLVLAACGTGPTVEEAEIAGELPDGPSALDDMNHPDFPEPLVDTSQIISGGPPPDGIPPIEDPEFISVDEADEWLQPQEPVVWLRIGDDVRAYPVQILMWHEIVNDTVGGTPVAVTYCPLCNSAISFERVVDGVETTFGTSGRLYHSALVMYDRATESLWSHFTGQAIVGVLTGAQLEIVPSPLVAWSDFRTDHPDALVLDVERTGHTRDYGRNPYAGYDDPDGTPFLFRGDPDERARAQQRVVGVELGDATRAWPLEAISGGEAQATTTDVGGERVVILWRAGQASALEVSDVGEGRDVGSVAVYRAEADGEPLTFTVSDGAFVDEETGSTWSLGGEGVDGPLAGERLEQVHHFDTFWFAWAAYQPDTDLVEEP
jgi:hypothetical protein